MTPHTKNITKKLHVTTFGCQMNEYDSQQLIRILAPLGYESTTDERAADLILINTCSIREKPEQKVYSHLGRLKKLKEQNPDLIIGVGGCVAQQQGEQLLRRVAHLDLVFGTHSIYHIPNLIKEVNETGRRLCSTDFSYDFNAPAENLSGGCADVKALVTIMRGCDNFCTFCIVPFVRGREVSRSKDEILAETEALVAGGVREVTLLGQNVNSYRPREGYGFVELLRDLNNLSGLERIRFTTSHPKDLSPELIDAFGSLEKLCPHIHLPVQSGSNGVLKRMNRKYTRERYLEKVERLRAARPDIAISTDIIVGFPGESDSDFQLTLDLMKEVRFDSSFSFKYSDRPYAKASMFTPKIDEEVKSARLSELQALQDSITLERNKTFEGTTQSVLVEGMAKKTPDKLTGRTVYNQVVNFSGSHELVGKLTPVRLETCYTHSMHGILVKETE